MTRILEMVADKGSVTVDEIIGTLEVSPATARRDLDALAGRGLLHRTRGGARSTVVAFDMPVHKKRGQQLEEKTAIAAYCVSMLEPGCVVGMSGGSTVGAIASAISDWATSRAGGETVGNQPFVTIVTNAVDIAYMLAGSPAIKVVLIGGVLNGSSYELTGPVGVNNLAGFSLDYAFIGANGIDANGPGTVDEFEAQTNQTMASRATRPVIVADSSKFGRRSFSSLGGPEAANTIVTDPGVDPAWVNRLTQAGYTIVTTDSQTT
ncbi:DeoR/GlpR family DNA-binding transcription regulator [Corynebacterium mendelii]|uniref:DeoR/GlpR transcriptional regulator n=1 Tax=Corynebacterium mendelii TaxID=2765362 RepID=A0A939E1W9_9CORY|nr:DeoR/GlpR family DNA-binding transcription regulator [Corynebacterium mendelii]MBN9644924.1 DeoR/GlpR transcriptional regulator [Corynebacterium mendelii]